MKSVNTLKPKGGKECFFEFMDSIINELHKLEKTRTAETYTSARRSLRKFYKQKNLPFYKLDAQLIHSYQSHLIQKGLSMNTISFYNRILRATYNRAVSQNRTKNRHPFKEVYTGVDKTLKRSVPISCIKKIKQMNFIEGSCEDFARDIFMFSFYTRGMSFIDIAYLQKKDLKNGILTYRRKKTGQLLFIRWEQCMENIVLKYYDNESQYLLPILNNDNRDTRKQYIYTAHRVNQALKKIGKRLNLDIPLTMYVARHSWASIAQNKNIPLSIISKGMGHDSEETTKIYLNSLDNNRIDNANNKIIRSL